MTEKVLSVRLTRFFTVEDLLKSLLQTRTKIAFYHVETLPNTYTPEKWKYTIAPKTPVGLWLTHRPVRSDGTIRTSE